MTAGTIKYELRVEMWDQEDVYAVAHYNLFKIVKDGQDYKLQVSDYKVVEGVQVKQADQIIYYNR